MGRKRMDGKEKIRIFAWRQENVTTKMSADVLRGKVICNGIVGCCT